jgi:hypothetical protein
MSDFHIVEVSGKPKVVLHDPAAHPIGSILDEAIYRLQVEATLTPALLAQVTAMVTSLSNIEVLLSGTDLLVLEDGSLLTMLSGELITL